MPIKWWFITGTYYTCQMSHWCTLSIILVDLQLAEAFFFNVLGCGPLHVTYLLLLCVGTHQSDQAVQGHIRVIKQCKDISEWSSSARTYQSDQAVQGHIRVIKQCKDISEWSSSARTYQSDQAVQGHIRVIKQCKDISGDQAVQGHIRVIKQCKDISFEWQKE